jgi:hypothetical protein
VRNGLQDLLVAPAGLARLLVEVQRGWPLGLEQRLDEAEQPRLALVARVELAGQGDLVHAKTGLAARLLERGQRVLAALMLRHREGDPLLRRPRQRTMPKL